MGAIRLPGGTTEGPSKFFHILQSTIHAGMVRGMVRACIVFQGYVGRCFGTLIRSHGQQKTFVLDCIVRVQEG
jgi:hypothetical protein